MEIGPLGDFQGRWEESENLVLVFLAFYRPSFPRPTSGPSTLTRPSLANFDRRFYPRQTAKNRKKAHFGYRARPVGLRQGIEDRFLQDQATGAEYRLRDTWGLRAPTRREGLRLMFDIGYKVVIIDRQTFGQVVRQFQWGVHLDVIAT